MDSILTVSGLTEILREALEKRVPFVWVRGEITNLSRPRSGHLYFSLKDSRSQLACVWFAARQAPGGEKFDPLTGEVFDEPRSSLADALQNGMEILCAGSIGIYAPKGQYQLIVELAQAAGVGELSLQFEQLKRKFDAAGFFASTRKRPLPLNPARIALITSPAGAAIHDFLELAQNRGLSAQIRLFPALVQGEGAAAQIARIIGEINSQDWAQVIVLIRGGGSLEDLWAFNEEILARAIFESRLPILAGIGHEVDFTLADLTADVRAATPSHAAQLLWPERAELWQRLDECESALTRAMSARLDSADARISQLSQALSLLSPHNKLERMQMRLAPLVEKLEREISLLITAAEARANALEGGLQPGVMRLLTNYESCLARFEGELSALNPELPLKRGYAYIYGETGVVNSVALVSRGENLHIVLQDGSLQAQITAIESKNGARE